MRARLTLAHARGVWRWHISALSFKDRLLLCLEPAWGTVLCLAPALFLSNVDARHCRMEDEDTGDRLVIPKRVLAAPLCKMLEVVSAVLEGGP